MILTGEQEQTGNDESDSLQDRQKQSHNAQSKQYEAADDS